MILIDSRKVAETEDARLGPVETSGLLRRSVLISRVEAVLFGGLLLLFVVRGFVPAWSRLDSDFANYYLAARLYRDGYPVERVYEWTWFQRQKDHLGIERPLVGFIPSTLTSSLLVLPLTSMSPLLANRVWLVLSLGLLLATAAILKKITNLTWRRIGLLMFLAVSPLYSNFRLGQVHVVLLLLLALAAWLYFCRQSFLSGAVLAAGAALKIYPALFLLFFLVKKQWRAAAGLACGTAGAVLVSVYLFGTTACRVYFREVLPWGLRGEIIDPYTTGWDSLNALLRRLLIFEPELNQAPIAHLPHLFAFLYSASHALILVVFLWAMREKDQKPARKKLEWAIYCFLLLLLSSEPLPYHFVILILTAVLLVDYLLARGQLIWMFAVIVLYALVCVPYDRIYRFNPGGSASLFFFPRLAWMLLLAIALLRILISDRDLSLRGRPKLRSLALAATAFSAVTAIGVGINLSHLKGQFDNYRSRVVTSIGAAIAVDPVATESSVYYGALVPRFSSTRDAYSVYRLQDGSINSFGGDGDWFHPAATPDDNHSWAEIALIQSRIVRFDHLGGIVSTEVNNAEQPVISADSRWLTYIREVRGRGSLWIRRVGSPSDGAVLGSERELVGPPYDVREATFTPDNQVFFSSWQSSQYRLYSVDFQSGAITERTPTTCSARYPAFSPDGQWLAFSCERNGVWQLVAMNRRTEEQQQLTTGDCNSITPAWTSDSKSLIYATDCGRGLGITALSKFDVVR